MVSFILTLIETTHKIKWKTFYYLLVGKKTSSTIVYGYFYELLPYFGLLPNLSMEQFQKIITKFLQEGLLIKEAEWLIATKKSDYSLKERYPALNMYQYGPTTKNQWELTLAAIQVLSEKSYQNKNYEIITNNYYQQAQLKKWLFSHELLKEDHYQQFYQELYAVLSKLPIETANHLSEEFVGHQELGKTWQQIYPEASFANFLQQLNDYHAFFREGQKQGLPLLLALWEKPTRSLDYTYELIQQGASFKELQQKRPDLKASTLRDHCIELAIAFSKEFPYERFYTLTEKQVLLAYQREKIPIPLWQFQDIKPKMANFLAYRLFQIETLAKNRGASK